MNYTKEFLLLSASDRMNLSKEELNNDLFSEK